MVWLSIITSRTSYVRLSAMLLQFFAAFYILSKKYVLVKLFTKSIEMSYVSVCLLVCVKVFGFECGWV